VTGETPELCTVVMSYRNEVTVLEAVRSLLDQDVPVEVVVSHSGGGETPEVMAREGIACVSSERRRLPGAARNAGVAATTAPFVSFLEGDCLAAPGWAAGRLARHCAGAMAVGSALEPFDGGRCSRAAWLVEHSARLPLRTVPDAAQHGLSFARSTLERFGPFPEDMLVGEDSEVTSRLLASGIEIEWAPEVVTMHRYPTTIPGLLADSWARGRRRAWTRIAERGRRTLARDAIRAPSEAARRALRPGAPVSRMEVWTALPLMWASAAAKTAAIVLF
jgi:Glycosyl transferase family 2